MSCAALENRLLDYLDGQLPPADHAAIAVHLAACTECARLAAELCQLDHRLSARFAVPVLSADFDRRLQARLAATAPGWNESELAERRRQLEIEFETSQVQLRRRAWAPASFLRQLMLAAQARGLVIVGGFLFAAAAYGLTCWPGGQSRPNAEYTLGTLALVLCFGYWLTQSPAPSRQRAGDC